MRSIVRALAALFTLAFSISAFAASLGSAPMNVDGLTLDLLSVERKGNVVTVKWSVRNETDAEKRIEMKLKGGSTTTYLVDEENGTKYYVLTDKEGHLLATEDSYDGIWEALEPKQTKRFWAKYPAPPPAVKTINVLFTDTEPFESVAITDK
jgi:hypothetical protein